MQLKLVFLMPKVIGYRLKNKCFTVGRMCLAEDSWDTH